MKHCNTRIADKGLKAFVNLVNQLDFILSWQLLYIYIYIYVSILLFTTTQHFASSMLQSHLHPCKVGQ